MELRAVLELILKRRSISYAVKIHEETSEISNVLVATKWHSCRLRTASAGILGEGWCGNKALDSKWGVLGSVV